MAKKAFEIQGSNLSLGGVSLQAGTTGVVIPGVTQAANYFVEELEDQDGNSPDTFGSNEGAVTVIDNSRYLQLTGTAPSADYVAATYSVDELDDGEINEINVETPGVFLAADKTRAEAGNMWATTTPTPFVSFNSANWTQIPYRPKFRAGEVTNVGGGGGAVVDRSVSFPNGEEGDTEGTLANDNGVLYFCTADYLDFNQYIDTPFSLETSEGFLIGQTDGTINSATISRNANAFVLFILQNGGLNASDWSITMADGDFGGEQTCTDLGFNVNNDIYFHWPHREEDPNSIPEGSEFTVTYTGTLARSAIWERISDNGSNRIEYYDEVLDYTSSVELTGNFRVDVDDAHLEVDGDGYWSLGSNNYDTKIFSTSRTGPDPVDIIIKANDNDWAFKSDGGLAFPDGTLQTTAYTGQSGGNTAVRYVAVNNDGTVYGSTDGENWTSYASPMTNVGKVAVGPTNIVYTADDSNPSVSGNSLWYATTYNSTPTEVPPPENVEEQYNEVKYFSSIEKYIAVGYVVEGVNFPVLLHSSDGVTWTRSYISEGFITELGFTGSAEFVDIAENDLGFFIISNSSTLGSFFLENITDALDGTTNVSQTDGYEHVVWVETAAVGFRGWHVFDNDEDWWFNANQDPRVGSFEYFAVEDLDPVLEAALGYSPSPGEFAVGEYNGLSTIVIGTGDGQILYWPAEEAGPFVSIPKPYTATITGWTSAAESVITYTGQEAENNNEKFTVTGSSVTAYNGTYYIDDNNNKVYTNRAMTVPFDTTGLAAFTGTATITWSHGRYIDALHYSNGIFYVGNDDEEFFISTDGGATWTETDSFTVGGAEDSSYLNDIDSYGTAVADTTTVVSQDIAPIAGNGSLWFNSLEGRLYIKYSDAWIDAAPLVQPPPDTDIDVNSITFSDATVLTSATALTPNKLVNGDNELVLGTDGTLTFPRGNLSVSSIQGQETIMGSTNSIISILAQGETGTTSLGWIEDGIDNVVGSNVAAVTINSPGSSSPGTVEILTGNSGIGPGTNTWEFGPDGKLTLPGAVVNSTVAKTGGSLGTETALDLTKTINKLADGLYTLADGVEGQIMYLVRQTGSVDANIIVNVAHARVDGSEHSDLDHYPLVGGSGSLTTLIFTDGHWQSTNGAWDL